MTKVPSDRMKSLFRFSRVAIIRCFACWNASVQPQMYTTSCFSTDSERPHRCCHRPSNVELSITCRLFPIPYNKKGSPYSITERRVLELIPVLGSQPAGDVSHKPGGRLPLLSAMHAVTPATLKRAATNFAAWWTMGVNSLPKTVTRQRRDCNLNPGPSAPESSTLATQLLSHPS